MLGRWHLCFLQLLRVRHHKNTVGNSLLPKLAENCLQHTYLSQSSGKPKYEAALCRHDLKTVEAFSKKTLIQSYIILFIDITSIINLTLTWSTFKFIEKHRKKHCKK